MKNYYSYNVPRSVKNELKEIKSLVKKDNNTDYKKSFLKFFHAKKLNVYGQAAYNSINNQKDNSKPGDRHQSLPIIHTQQKINRPMPPMVVQQPFAYGKSKINIISKVIRFVNSKFR